MEETVEVAWRRMVIAMQEMTAAMDGMARVMQVASQNDQSLKVLLNNSEANNQRRAVIAATPEETFVSNSDSVRARRIRCQLPVDFGLSVAMHVFATDHGMPVAEHEEQFVRFCEHHRARGSTMKDWTLAWYTWARNYQRFDGGRPRPKADYIVPESIRQALANRGALRPREKGPGGRRGA